MALCSTSGFVAEFVIVWFGCLQFGSPNPGFKLCSTSGFVPEFLFVFRLVRFQFVLPRILVLLQTLWLHLSTSVFVVCCIRGKFERGVFVRTIWCENNVPEVLIVHTNEIYKELTTIK